MISGLEIIFLELIDLGSIENMTSQLMVDKLKLALWHHPKLYNISWFK